MNEQAAEEEKAAKRKTAVKRRAARQWVSRLEAALREVERLQENKNVTSCQIMVKTKLIV